MSGAQKLALLALVLWSFGLQKKILRFDSTPLIIQVIYLFLNHNCVLQFHTNSFHHQKIQLV